MSGQSRVDDGTVNELLGSMAARHPDLLFICTSPYPGMAAKNIAFSQYLIGDPPWGRCDLNETAYLGTYCDVIIGRCSGPQSFCYNTDVLLDPTKTLICLCDDERTAKWVYMSDAVKAKIVWTPAADSETLYGLISKELAA